MKKVLKCFSNNQGFSLVEMIIVVAIIVALTVVMAPSYVKYVQKARDIVVTDAAENIVSFAKSEFSAMELTGCAEIRVFVEGTSLKVTIDELPGENKTKFCYKETYLEDGGGDLFIEECGIDPNKRCNSRLAYLIKIDGTIFSRPILIEVESSRAENK